MAISVLKSKLEEYTQAQKQLATFRKDNLSVFQYEAELRFAVEDAENELKDTTREVGVRLIIATSRLPLPRRRSVGTMPRF